MKRPGGVQGIFQFRVLGFRDFGTLGLSDLGLRAWRVNNEFGFRGFGRLISVVIMLMLEFFEFLHLLAICLVTAIVPIVAFSAIYALSSQEALAGGPYGSMDPFSPS